MGQDQDQLEGQGETTPHAVQGHGGKRAGAGRPRGPRGGRFVPLRGDRVYAKNLISDLMRDESQPAVLRARLAVVVAMKGVWQRHDSGTPGVAVQAAGVDGDRCDDSRHHVSPVDFERSVRAAYPDIELIEDQESVNNFGPDC
jgi:hypothetical protein